MGRTLLVAVVRHPAGVVLLHLTEEAYPLFGVWILLSFKLRFNAPA